MLGARAASIDRDAAGRSTLALEGTNGARTTIQCRVVIAATGLGGSFAARELGGEIVTTGSRIGASTVLDEDARVSWQDHAVNMAAGVHGYVGAVRLEDGRWNLAAALDAHAVALSKGVGPVVATILGSGRWPVPPEVDGAVLARHAAAVAPAATPGCRRPVRGR